MLEGLNNFVKEANSIIKKENRKINDLHKQISDYETLIFVVGQTGTQEHVMYYKDKIRKCYSKIDVCLENISNSRNRIAALKVIDKVIKRGEKCA